MNLLHINKYNVLGEKSNLDFFLGGGWAHLRNVEVPKPGIELMQ